MAKDFFDKIMKEGRVTNIPPYLKQELTNMLEEALKAKKIKGFQIGNLFSSEEFGIVATINNKNISSYMTEKDLELCLSAC